MPRSEPPEGKRQQLFWLTDELADALDSAAKNAGVSKTALVELVLRNTLSMPMIQPTPPPDPARILRALKGK